VDGRVLFDGVHDRPILHGGFDRLSDPFAGLFGGGGSTAIFVWAGRRDVFVHATYPWDMDEVSLTIPAPILDSLPDDGDAAAQDMERAVEGWEQRINRAIEESTEEGAAAGYVVDAIERLEARLETYDEFVPELRAWGQSPIYAIAWRNLMADLIGQLSDHEDLADRLDRERNARLVDDGIRLSDRS